MKKTLTDISLSKQVEEFFDPNMRPQIWKSRLAWRIALSVFLTMLIVQTAITYYAIKDYKQALLDHAAEAGRSAIVSILEAVPVDLSSVIIDKRAVSRVLKTTVIEGFAIYELSGTLIEEHGEKTSLPFYELKNQSTLLSEDWSRYEKAFFNKDLNKPYTVILRLNISNLKMQMMDHISHSIYVILLLSGFVTSVLMLVLGRWLLEPIIILHNNLLGSSIDPENPDKYITNFDKNDEVGVVVKAANRLIHQNAEKISTLKGQAEDTIHRLAYFDGLTGLPNRTMFLQELQKTIDGVEEGGSTRKRIVVSVVDLDYFKDINDTMGHHIGDEVLIAVGQRLKSSMKNDNYVARCGEDEFAIIAVVNENQNNATQDVARMIIEALESPFLVAGEAFSVKGSVGVARYPEDGREPNKLLKSADIALNRAKQDGRDTVRSYSSDFDKEVQERFQMIRDLRLALENKELQLYYQPQFDLKSGKICGAEALIRWWKEDADHEDGGVFIPPAEFIPLAEQSGLIVPIGKWVLEKACAQNKKWQDAGLKPIRIAVNISAIQFQQADMVRQTKQILQDTELDPKYLELEVTESVFMDDINKTIHTLRDLNTLGIELAIDDFGTGYSSLSYLRQFPIDRLKIDQSFIKNALTNDSDLAITKTIVNLGHALGIKVIAEGVETKEQEAFLKAQDCDEVQGFLYSKPMPLKEFEAYFKTSK